jgi:hypothetical protein
LPLRIGVVVASLLHAVLFGVGLAPYLDTVSQPCRSEAACQMLLLTAAEFDLVRQAGFSPATYAASLAAAELLLVGFGAALTTLLIWRASHTWIGLVTSMGIIFLVVGIGNVLPYGAQQLPVLTWVIASSMFCLMLLTLIFPNGRFDPGWTRLLVGPMLVAALLFVPNYYIGHTQGENLWGSALVGLGALILAMLISSLLIQIYRYRRLYSVQERIQTRWFIVGLSILTASIVLWTALYESPLIQPGPLRVYRNVFLTPVINACIAAIPNSLTIAILRYRLWDIDLIIRRTLIYTSITVVLAGVYFAGVALLQSGFVILTGQESPLAVVASTLGIAALFNPVRRRAQEVIDRRFFRRKYNAEKTVDAFARTVRDEVDIDCVREVLLDTVADTMQPEHVSLWIRGPIS